MTEKVKEHGLSFIQEFIAFVKAFGVVGLALGVVIGNAVNSLAQSLSLNIITPVIGLLFQSQSFQNYQIGVLRIGAFTDDLINFLIILFVVWAVIKVALSSFLSDQEKEKLGIMNHQDENPKT